MATDLTLVTSDQAFKGLFEWFKQNDWFLKDNIEGADLSREWDAHRGVLMLASGQCDAYRQLPDGVRSLVSMLMMDFLAKLIGPLGGKTWEVLAPAGSPSSSTLAWLVVQQEVGVKFNKPIH